MAILPDFFLRNAEVTPRCIGTEVSLAMSPLMSGDIFGGASPNPTEKVRRVRKAKPKEA